MRLVVIDPFQKLSLVFFLLSDLFFAAKPSPAAYGIPPAFSKLG
jgi:hypothetical protein